MSSAIIWMCSPKKERATISFLQLFLSLNVMLKCFSSEEVKWTGLLFSWISFFWWFPNRKLLSTFYDRSHPSWQDSILKQMRRDKKGKYSCQEFLDIKWKYSQQSNKDMFSQKGNYFQHIIFSVKIGKIFLITELLGYLRKARSVRKFDLAIAERYIERKD